MKKVILLEHSLAHYRKDVFELLFNNNEFEFNIIAGRAYKGVKGIENSNYTTLKYRKFSLLNHEFYFLKGAIKKILLKKPELLICTGFDAHLLHAILLFLVWRIIFRRKFYWWSHGTTGSQGKVGFLFRRFFYKNANGILAYSDTGKKSLISMGVRPENIVVLGNSNNLEDYGYINYDILAKREDSSLKILYSGRLSIEKRIEFLLNALKVFHEKYNIDFTCNIIGYGENLDKYKTIANQLMIQNKVKFVGPKYGKDVHHYFLDADLFVYPSGIGLSILHALSFGLPIITTNKWELHFPEVELLDPGKNGELFEHDSYDDLAKKLFDWSKKIRNSRNNYRQNCINSIKKYGYLPDVMFDKIVNFIMKQ